MLKYQTLIIQYPQLSRVVAVSKTQSSSAINEAIENGYHDFGENKVQELKVKAQTIENVCWHFIGHLQTNKIKDVITYASWIHSVDSIKLINALEKECSKQNKQMNVLLQVNLSEENQKNGCTLQECPQLCEYLSQSNFLSLKGLMVMGPSSIDIDQTRKIFKQAHALLKELQLSYPDMTELSMGMSQDYPVAIEEGSTILRLGSLLFGQRTLKHTT